MSVYSLGHFFNWIFAVFLRFYSFQTLSPFFSLFYATAANPYSNHHPIDESVLSFSSVNNRDNRIVHVTLSTRLKGSRIRKRKEVSGIAITGFTSRVFFFFFFSFSRNLNTLGVLRCVQREEISPIEKISSKRIVVEQSRQFERSTRKLVGQRKSRKEKEPDKCIAEHSPSTRQFRKEAFEKRREKGKEIIVHYFVCNLCTCYHLSTQSNEPFDRNKKEEKEKKNLRSTWNFWSKKKKKLTFL